MLLRVRESKLWLIASSSYAEHCLLPAFFLFVQCEAADWATCTESECTGLIEYTYNVVRAFFRLPTIHVSFYLFFTFQKCIDVQRIQSSFLLKIHHNFASSLLTILILNTSSKYVILVYKIRIETLRECYPLQGSRIIRYYIYIVN